MFLGSCDQFEQQDSSKIDVTRLIKEFCYFMIKVQIILSNCASETDFNHCKDYCSYLTISVANFGELFGPKEAEEIKNSLNFQQLFRTVKNYVNWDDYSILTYFIGICNSEEAEKEVEMFERKLAVYRGLEFIANTPEMNPPSDYKRFLVIFNKNYRTLTVEEYEEIKKGIFHILDTHPRVTSNHIRVHLASIHLEWHVTIQAVDHLSQMVCLRTEELKKYSVVHVEIGSTVLLDDEVILMCRNMTSCLTTFSFSYIIIVAFQ